MCIVEDAPKGGKAGGADAKVRIGVVAVVPSTGTVVYDGAPHKVCFFASRCTADREEGGEQSSRTRSCAQSSRRACSTSSRPSYSSRRTSAARPSPWLSTSQGSTRASASVLTATDLASDSLTRLSSWTQRRQGRLQRPRRPHPQEAKRGAGDQHDHDVLRQEGQEGRCCCGGGGGREDGQEGQGQGGRARAERDCALFGRGRRRGRRSCPVDDSRARRCALSSQLAHV